ncbi:XRE family transcriptional regulator [Corallococcus sp. AB045]|uniref:helix-turn-helix domain-containing protein n=1 Tax=Corallococcus sp. AB045 TaxID=2316719 RepID=UPI000EE2C093|nr:helix-turn-helix transcriptional regulator [Corallococcus sp. AB045]RKH85051.1 XRE family transcriptional regulator [Corallococcus sp. AB045]
MTRKSRRKLWKGPLPTSGEILGGVASLFEWKPRHSAQDRTWRKYITGGAIHEKTRRGILQEFIEAGLPDAGASLTRERLSAEREQTLAQLVDVLVAHVSWWDDLCARRKAALPIEASRFINTVVLRLAVVELAVRLAPLGTLHLPQLQPLSKKPERIDVPEHLLTTLLRQVLKELKITRNALSEALDVSKEAVDQWLANGKVIGLKRLDEIAEVVAQKLGGRPEVAKGILRMVRLLTQVFEGLREQVGQEELNDLIEGLWRLTQVASSECERRVAFLPALEREQVLGELVVLGSAIWPGPMLREAMQAAEEDDSWRRVISALPHQWEGLLAEALGTEKQFLEIRELCLREGFKYLLRDEARVATSKLVKVLVPKERLPSVLVQLEQPTPEDGMTLIVPFVFQYGEHLFSEEAGPDGWRELLALGETCRLLMRSANNSEYLAALNQISWISYVKALLLIGTQMKSISNEDLLGKTTWDEQVREALEALPPIPEAVKPELGETLHVLLEMRDTLEQTLRWLQEIRGRAHRQLHGE